MFDRGVVSEDNLQDLRQRGAYYLVGAPHRKLANFERELLEGDWQESWAGKPGMRVQLLSRAKRPSLRSQLVRLQRSLRARYAVLWPVGGSKTQAKIPSLKE